MNTLDYRDYLVIVGSILAIALYGIFRTRGRRNLHDYLRGKKQGGGSWFAIGLSVMATQASAITFLSTPGQGYASGMSFVQNYFAVPLALIIIAAFFLPIFRKLNVYTAYEYLGNRFDKKTRLLAAALFLLNRGMGAGYTIYAPAIVLSTVFGWSLTATIIASSLVVIVYTTLGGSDAVTHTQKFQIAVIFAGMIAAFFILLSKIPCSFTDALTLAGHFGKLNAVTFTPAGGKTFWSDRYTFWSGMLGGIFLMLSYFGTDQSQVQRYISGDDLRESRLGLMFNALFKIPMQFFILLLGVMLFVFYLFNAQPMLFNKSEWQQQLKSTKPLQASLNPPARPDGSPMSAGEVLQMEQELFDATEPLREESIRAWIQAHSARDAAAESLALDMANQAQLIRAEARKTAKEILGAIDPKSSANDNDYVFITFIKDNLPHGLIGLLVASFFLAALSSKAAELTALASCTTIDLYRYLIRPESPPSATARGNVPSSANAPASVLSPQSSVLSSDRHYVRASKLFTILWGLIAMAFALFCNLSENLIQATNILASLFYPILLSLFLCGFFLKFLTATPVFIGALCAQALVLTLYFTVPDATLSYLWYNPIGVLCCITVAAALQPLIGKPQSPPGFPVLTESTPTN